MSQNDVFVAGDKDSGWAVHLGAGAKGLKMQTRFQTIPSQYLNLETVGGVRDMNLGKVKNGQPVGGNIIRFDTGLNTGKPPHINFDPAGKSSASNPHWKVPAEVVKGAEVVHKTLKYAGVTLTVAALAIDIWRLGSAAYDDVQIRKNADAIIRELEEALLKLNKELESTSDEDVTRDIKSTVEHLQKVLRDVKRTKKAPVKTIKTVAAVAGSWGGAALYGAAGAQLGAGRRCTARPGRSSGRRQARWRAPCSGPRASWWGRRRAGGRARGGRGRRRARGLPVRHPRRSGRRCGTEAGRLIFALLELQ